MLDSALNHHHIETPVKGKSLEEQFLSLQYSSSTRQVVCTNAVLNSLLYIETLCRLYNTPSSLSLFHSLSSCLFNMPHAQLMKDILSSIESIMDKKY